MVIEFRVARIAVGYFTNIDFPAGEHDQPGGHGHPGGEGRQTGVH